MNFVDSEYVALLAAAFGLWLVLRPWPNAAQAMLLVASVVFYGFHDWRLVFLLGGYCVVNWACGLAITRGPRRALALAAGVGANLAALCFWKYTPLLVNSVAWLATGEDPGHGPIDAAGWYLPIGISFFTFTGIAYLADVYRGNAVAERNPLRFALYLSFFPQLVAGPILRAQEFLVDLKPDAMARAMPRIGADLREAMFLMARGAFKKLVIADGIARAIDPFFAHVGDGSTAGAWSLPYLYLYSLQIFFDFSGYTDIARGGGLLFGFRWPVNFDRPYLAGSVRDFWRRWHMTLSRFLRDYVYIPLGGSRRDRVRTGVAIMATMLLGGLWHGAAWSFMLWGGLHGLYLLVHRMWRLSPVAARLDAMPAPARRLWHVASVILTFHLVTATWSFFRLTDLQESLACVEKLFVFDGATMFQGGAGDAALWTLVAVYLALSAAGAALWPRLLLIAEQRGGRAAALLDGAVWGLIAALFTLAYLLSAPGRGDPFIYFRF